MENPSPAAGHARNAAPHILGSPDGTMEDTYGEFDSTAFMSDASLFSQYLMPGKTFMADSPTPQEPDASHNTFMSSAESPPDLDADFHSDASGKSSLESERVNDTTMADASDPWKDESLNTGFVLGGEHPVFRPHDAGEEFTREEDSLYNFNFGISPEEDTTNKSINPAVLDKTNAMMPQPELETNLSRAYPLRQGPSLPQASLPNSGGPVYQSPNLQQESAIAHTLDGDAAMLSRETSPASRGVYSQHSSPFGNIYDNFYNNSPSPAAPGSENGLVQARPSLGQGWAANGMQPYDNFEVRQRMTTPGPFPNLIQPPKLIIHSSVHKIRVETQIIIKLTLSPLPLGITKLRLPSHTITKSKMRNKGVHPELATDTLNLHASVVATSAMHNGQLKQRALERATVKFPVIPVYTTPDKDNPNDPNRPVNGADVPVCENCIVREQKRAKRKKVMKAEEEEMMLQDEEKRIIIFNTSEIKEWLPPAPQEVNGKPTSFQEGSMQVDLPMRITCYCRHHQEKEGFRVIFTIKDSNFNVVAQAMSNSIMITDDHKTSAAPPPTTESATGADSPVEPTSGASTRAGSYDVSPSNFPSTASAVTLQNTHQTPNVPRKSSLTTSQATSATATLANFSRHSSPVGPGGPVSKKRKSSTGMIKVPSELAMTRLNTEPSSGAATMPASASNSTTTSPFTPNHTSPNGTVPNFPHALARMPATLAQQNNGPTTPNNGEQFSFASHRSQSMDNLAFSRQMYSEPNSTRPSRAPSPNSAFNNVHAYPPQPQPQQQMQFQGPYPPQSVAPNLYPMQQPAPQPIPTIHKLIPGEGPTSGGVEVTILGSMFSQGLEVMFGDQKATTTTFWGETSLVCLLPPSAKTGDVAVTFKQQQPQHMPGYARPHDPHRRHIFFRYVDDREQQLIRTALEIMANKMNGSSGNAVDFAQQIIRDPQWSSSSNGHAPNGGGGYHGPNVNGFNAATLGMGFNVEETILKCLDVIDLDDSPHMPRFNLRRASGQTMLHLACSLGYQRLVAALLARGANPEARDKGGYTPMHFAALHDHPQIVRRLMLHGADPMMRNLQGNTPSDMTTSEEVVRVARRLLQHSRARSTPSLRSLTSSATSLRSLWEPSPFPSPRAHSRSPSMDNRITDVEGADAVEDDEDDEVFWMRRRSRAQTLSRKQSMVALGAEADPDPALELPPNPDLAADHSSAGAAMAVFREQVGAQIQHLQHLMQTNMPTLPNFAMMPHLPDYQTYLPTTPMVRRISNMVGHNRTDAAKEQDYKWSDLFSRTPLMAPPAYEDIFPVEEEGYRKKFASASNAAADAVADASCAKLFEQFEAVKTTSTSYAESSKTATQRRPAHMDTVRIGSRTVISREQQDQLRQAHADKMKRLSRDRNLFFIWIPLLVIISLAMLYNRAPQAWKVATEFFAPVTRNGPTMAPVVEV